MYEPTSREDIEPGSLEGTGSAVDVVSAPPETTRSIAGSWWRGPLQAVRALLETVIPALVIAIGINLFLAQATQVLGQSMEPNLHTSQRLVVEKVIVPFSRSTAQRYRRHRSA